MRFGDNFLEELKARVRPSDVVGRHVKLKRQGREFAGLSPFTNEKTPSFFVNDEKGFYHCFSSGKHGDQISFLMEVEGLSFPEAVEALATMAGMEMPQVDPQAEARAARNKETVSWMERAQEFFEKTLYRGDGDAARDYLKGRGMSKTAARAFGMGFAPESFSALKDELIAQGAMPEQLIEAGLLVEPEDRSRQPWDRFRDRIMFPIHDGRGRLVAFGGRAMAKDAKAKYLNSPETPIFQKSKLLYNYHRARKAFSDPQNSARGLIVAEGYMDVIALARAGFTHSVAPMGTALTEDQLELLWRVGPEPILCFDGDKAGIRAAFRSIERALPLLRPGQSIRFAMLPDGQDPDDLIRASGPPAMQTVLNNAVPMVDMLWRREVEVERLDTPEAKAGMKSRLYKALDEIQNGDVKALYKTELLARFDSEFGWKAGRKKRFSSKEAGETKANKKTQVYSAVMLRKSKSWEVSIVGGVLLFPEMLDQIDERFFQIEFMNDEPRILQAEILLAHRENDKLNQSVLSELIYQRGGHQAYASLLKDRELVVAPFGGKNAVIEDRVSFWVDFVEQYLQKMNREIAKQDRLQNFKDSINSDNAHSMHQNQRVALDSKKRR